MRLGYNTNGLAHHDPLQAVELLAELGYASVAITLDHHVLNPFADTHKTEVARMKGLLSRLGMKSVVETGARFLLDFREKHEPTLLSPEPAGRRRRIDFLKAAVDIAAELESDCVSLWSGILREEISRQQALDRLTEGLRDVLEHAADKNVVLGFEPEPGMLIDTMAAYEELRERIDSPFFLLTLDIGHLHCQGEVPIPAIIRAWAPHMVNVHLEDMRTGVHEHLMFGAGEMDFPPILDALAEVGYQGGVHVELSRHSHAGPQAARAAYEFLSPLMPK